MIKNAKGSEVCLYCNSPILESSDEHIFPEFMGGRKTIDSCAACKTNNIFGGTFEGRMSQMLYPLHTAIATWGLTLKKIVPAWKRGYEFEGQQFDLSIGKTNEIQFRLSKPKVEKDEQDKIKSITYSSEKEARQAAENNSRKGKAKRIVIERSFKEIPFTGGAFNFELNPDFYRLALKMCFTLSTLLPEITLEEIVESQIILKGNQLHLPENVFPSFDDYDSLDSLRDPLCHLIYVERNKTRIYGIVQIYGVIQIYCNLGKPTIVTKDSAMLGILDPVTGKEEFNEIMPLNLSYPSQITDREIIEGGEKWLKKFHQSAIDRGAKSPPNISGNWSIIGNSDIE